MINIRVNSRTVFFTSFFKILLVLLELTEVPFSQYLTAYFFRELSIIRRLTHQSPVFNWHSNPREWFFRIKCPKSHGNVVGTWKRFLRSKSVKVCATLFEPMTKIQKELLSREAERYAHFLGKQLELTFE